MKIKDIKTPEDILQFMKENISYGWIDINGEKHINNMKNFRRLYRTSTIEETLDNGIGTCIEQVNLMSYLLKNLSIPYKTFCTRIYEDNNFTDMEAEEHMHCFILYYLNGKVYQIEHPNPDKVGIHEYKDEKTAIEKINEYYVNMSGKIARPVTQFYEVPPNLTFKEFNNYINSLDNTSDFTVEKTK